MPDSISVDDKGKREQDITEWLSLFSQSYRNKYGEDVHFQDESAKLINTWYWETLEETVRPRMVQNNGTQTKIDRHKIASLLELIIVHVQPVLASTQRHSREQLCARLAYFVAINLIGNWHPDRIKTLFVSDSFHREHLAWLTNSTQSEGFPIFSNAATWYLFELICEERTTASLRQGSA